MENKIPSKKAVNGVLADLANAYELVSAIATISKTNSKSRKYAIVALPEIEGAFNFLSRYGNPASFSLKEKIEKARIVPEL